MTSFADFLRTARADLGITCKQLAEATEINRRSLENWEQGRTEPPAYVQRQIISWIEKKKGVKQKKL